MAALVEGPLVRYYIDSGKNEILDVSYPLLNLLDYTKEEITHKGESPIERIGISFSKLEAFESGEKILFFDKKNTPYMAKVSIESINTFTRIELFQVENLLQRESINGVYQLMKNSLQPMALYEPEELRLIYGNDSFWKLLETHEAAVKPLGKPILCEDGEIKPKEYGFLIEKVLKACKPFHKKVYIRRFRKSLYKFTNLSLIPIGNKGKGECLVFSAEEVSEVREEKEALFKEKESLHNIINYLDIPMIYLSYPDLRVVRINDNARGIFKYSADSSSHLYINSILSDESEDYSFIFEDFKSIEETIYYNNKYLGGKIFNIICQPHRNIKGNIFAITIIFIDITEEVKKRDEIISLLKAQEEFFAFISHEFKTPITVILSAVQVMEFTRSKELSPLAKEYLYKIKKSAFQQLRLVNNLLDISRADSGYLKINPKNINLVEVTRLIIDSIEPYAKEKGLELVFKTVNESMVIGLDDEKYERILLNLLSNAIKFTPSGKKIYIDIKEENEKALISVKDEGIGIPKDKLKYIFERYAQVDTSYSTQVDTSYSQDKPSEITEVHAPIKNYEGSGIGLCLAKLMTKALGGDIVAYSTVGKGSEFQVQLPKSLICEEKESLGREMDFLDDRLMRSVNIEFSNLETS